MGCPLDKVPAELKMWVAAWLALGSGIMARQDNKRDVS